MLYKVKHNFISNKIEHGDNNEIDEGILCLTMVTRLDECETRTLKIKKDTGKNIIILWMG